jgi:chemotaxis protein CheC
MELTVPQKDALSELINIGYGRAAGALSELTGYRITLEVPNVSMHEIAEIAPMLEDVVHGEVASVNQMFSGPISGTAMLLLDERSAAMLSQLLTDQGLPPPKAGPLDASAREIITEVGNILLNACLGVFGNLLQVHVSFSVPRLHVESIPHVLESINVETDEKLRYGLMIHTRFRLRASNVTGYLVIILGITSLDRMLRELENWENRQSS